MPLPAPLDGVTAEEFSGPGAYDAALAWFGAEHRVLRNVIEQAAAQRQDEHCWKLAWDWAPLLKRRGTLHELLAVQRTAVLAAGRLGDRDALAHVHYELGHASGRLGDYQSADDHLRQALEPVHRARRPGQRGHGRSTASPRCSTPQNRYDEALDHAVEALRLRRAAADRAVIAYSENAVGWILAHLGQPDAALWYCRRALEMHDESGSRTGIADTLDSIAYAHGQLADYEQSVAHYEQAVEMYRVLGDLQGEANSRLHLGDVRLASGQPEAARRSWEQALTLLARVPGADTGEVSERLSPAAGRPGPRDGPDSRNDRAGRGTVKLRTVVSELLHPGEPAVRGGGRRTG